MNQSVGNLRPWIFWSLFQTLCALTWPLTCGIPRNLASELSFTFSSFPGSPLSPQAQILIPLPLPFLQPQPHVYLPLGYFFRWEDFPGTAFQQTQYIRENVRFQGWTPGYTMCTYWPCYPRPLFLSHMESAHSMSSAPIIMRIKF